MFTGIVEEIGRVENIKKGPKSLTINNSRKKIFSDLKLVTPLLLMVCA